MTREAALGLLALLCFGRIERGPEVERVDDVEQIAPVDVLVVHDVDLGDLARHLRRHAGHLHAHAPVARPGRDDVLVPHYDGRNGGAGEGRAYSGFGARPPGISGSLAGTNAPRG